MLAEQSKSTPVEKGWPLLGILPKFFSGDPFEYLKNTMLEKGDFVQLNFGPKPVYLVSHPDYIQRILRDNYQNYIKPGMLYDTAKKVMGDGLVHSTGDKWLRQRRMIQPHLHRKELINLFTDMKNAISGVLIDWESLAKNGIVFELGERMGAISMNVTSMTMFGQNTLSPATVLEIGNRITRIGKYNGKDLYSNMLPKWFPIPGRREFEEDISAVREAVNQIIAKCRAEKGTSASLIQMLINSVDEESNEQMTGQQLFDEVMTIFIAGYETTATALTWMAVVLEKYPDVLQKLKAEIDDVLGERTPSFEDMPRLVYTRNFFMELLRMYTVAAFLPRQSGQADRLGNYDLPANSLVLMFFHGVHHNPTVWDDPEVFNPDRFKPENSVGRHAFAYLPFSAGPRKCVGDEFALLEGPLAIAMILQKYNINILPNQVFSARLGSTMHPGNGVKVSLSAREKQLAEI